MFFKSFKITLIIIWLLSGTNSYAETKKFSPLPKDFSNNFTVGETEGLTGRILFTAEIDGFERILLLDLDNDLVTKVIDGPGSNSYPSWSPDGTHFSFASNRDGDYEIYIADFEGKNIKQITNNELEDHNPAWSNNGEEILYYREKKSETKELITNIFSYSLKTKKNTKLTNFKRGKNSTPRLSPDGKLIAFSTNRYWPGWDICIWNRARESEDCVLTGTISYCRPAWSASGKLLAYSGGAFSGVDISIYNLESGNKKLISDLEGREYDVVWSPSGRELAFAGEVETGKYNLFLDRQLRTSPLLKSKYSTRYLSWSSITTLELEANKINTKDVPDEEQLLHPLFIQ
ncbi:MAG: hypothetical protein R3A13_08215 [Bdellovibrionota bacterium]